MKLPTGQTRVKMPNHPCLCRLIRCVYNVDGMCDEPRINRANGDSECHSVTPRVVIADYLIAASDSAETGSGL